ncbi:hypothetical protein MPER_05130, partial [Moniliophthora perniciosa FA553]
KVESRLAQVILTIPPVKDSVNLHPSLQFATTVFSYQTSSIVGMYPTIIICIVHAQRSAMDTTLCSIDGSDSYYGREATFIALTTFRTAATRLGFCKGRCSPNEHERRTISRIGQKIIMIFNIDTLYKYLNSSTIFVQVPYQYSDTCIS